MATSTYTISMLGPSRVGKTSIIASVFNTAEKELLAGKPFTLNSDNHRPTQKKLAMHARELRSSINARHFNSGAVAGTQEPFHFHFELSSVKDKDVSLGFEILDFPGGWIDTINRPDNVESKWKACQDTIYKSSVLIIPVEAGVLMNAKTPEELRAIEHNLQIEEIKTIVTTWAKQRQVSYPDVPSTIILTPVKGESYFTDNPKTGNNRKQDRSKDLYDQTLKYYEPVIEAAKTEFNKSHNLSILYTAIDTIGNVFLEGGEWVKEGDTLRFSGEYKPCDNNGGLHPKGGEDIFVIICKTLIQTQKYQEQRLLDTKTQHHEQANQAAKKARQKAEEDRGFFGNIGMWWTGEREVLRAEARKKAQISTEAEYAKNAQALKLQSIAELITEISKERLSERTKAII